MPYSTGMNKARNITATTLLLLALLTGNGAKTVNTQDVPTFGQTISAAQ